jgi:hypothetical protein
MPTKLPAHTWRRPRNARNWTTGAPFRDHTTCECLLGHLYGAVPSALSSLELDPHKQTPGRLSARSRGSTHKVRHRPRRLRPQQAPRMPTPEKAPNPNFPGPQRRSPPAYAPAAARPAPKNPLLEAAPRVSSCSTAAAQPTPPALGSIVAYACIKPTHAPTCRAGDRRGRSGRQRPAPSFAPLRAQRVPIWQPARGGRTLTAPEAARRIYFAAPLRARRCAACALSLVRPRATPRFRATARAPGAGRGAAAPAARLAGWGRACAPADVPFMGGHGFPRAAAVDRRGLGALRQRGRPPSRADFANCRLYRKPIYAVY